MNRERWQQLLAAALALAVWQGAAMLVHAPILLPSPLRVADRLGALLVTLDFWSTVGFSLLRIAGGFLLALAAATVGYSTSAYQNAVGRPASTWFTSSTEPSGRV